ncbi:Permease of the drug/metabolite transporter (DMT) superfamily [hydrothermal vent metagenome]|uniref:Permease of the drug/metabolite transporter (DMT) superfamily n=1 Tax=hydrothermal vent metagenome TaxID=652676 RepID=A0A3B1DL07_9ZZZZ
MLEKNIKIRAYAAWFAVSIIWGTTYLAIRVGVGEMPPFIFSAPRWILAGIIYLIILKWRGYSFPKKSDYKHIVVVGLLLLGVANGFLVVAEQWIPSGLAAILITTVPFVIVLLESVILRKRKLNLFIISGIIIGFIGVALILGNNLSLLFIPDYSLGVILISIGLISWALGSVYSKYHKLTVHPFMSAAFQMLIAGFFQLILSVVLGETENFVISNNSMLAFLYLFLFGSLIAYGSYMYAIEKLPISFVSTYAYINPVIALFIGWLFLDEILTIQIIIGALIILVGVYLVNRGNNL